MDLPPHVEGGAKCLGFIHEQWAQLRLLNCCFAWAIAIRKCLAASTWEEYIIHLVEVILSCTFVSRTKSQTDQAYLQVQCPNAASHRRQQSKGLNEPEYQATDRQIGRQIHALHR